MSGALIITAGLGTSDQAWFDGLRRFHYPPDRNRVPAHLTMIHALPPSVEMEVVSLMKRLAKASAILARTAGLKHIGNGVAVRIESPELLHLREQMADHFHGTLTAQDSGTWWPHITIQNKVTPKQADQLIQILDRDWKDGAVRIGSLDLHRYRDGSWDSVGRFAFRA